MRFLTGLLACMLFAQQPLATFTGKVRGTDKRGITIERGEENLMLFHCTRKTTYWDGKKKIPASAIRLGDAVAVEGRMLPDRSMEAVNVRVERAKSEPQASGSAPRRATPGFA